MSLCIVVTLTDNMEEAKRIAHELVGNKLASCTNIVQGVTSVYRWKDEVREEGEFMLKIKTRKELFEDVKSCIKKNHSYELPACFMLSIKTGSNEFLGWIKENTI